MTSVSVGQNISVHYSTRARVWSFY